MSFNLDQGVSSSTTRDWLRASEGMMLTAFDPSFGVDAGLQMIEPDQAVDLPASERARMNRTNPGVYTPPQRL